MLKCREEHRRGQDWIGPELGVPARTVCRVLRRHDVPYLRECGPMTREVIRSSKATANRYERDRPGELVHVDSHRSAACNQRCRRTRRPRCCA